MAGARGRGDLHRKRVPQHAERRAKSTNADPQGWCVPFLAPQRQRPGTHLAVFDPRLTRALVRGAIEAPHVPRWFRGAEFGIFIHLGVLSVLEDLIARFTMAKRACGNLRRQAK